MPLNHKVQCEKRRCELSRNWPAFAVCDNLIEQGSNYISCASFTEKIVMKKGHFVVPRKKRSLHGTHKGICWFIYKMTSIFFITISLVNCFRSKNRQRSHAIKLTNIDFYWQHKSDKKWMQKMNENWLKSQFSLLKKLYSYVTISFRFRVSEIHGKLVW